jgi:hypothetical protein
MSEEYQDFEKRELQRTEFGIVVVGSKLYSNTESVGLLFA